MALFLWSKGLILKSGISLGLASAFKTFPLLILPFLLFSKGELKNKITLTAVTLVIYGITILPFIQSEAFRSNVLFSGLTQRIFQLQIPLGQFGVAIFPILYLLLLVHRFKFPKISIYSYGLSVLLLIYSVSRFHPQWIVWATPFLSLSLAKKQMRAFFLIILFLILLSPAIASLSIRKTVGLNNQAENHIEYFYKDKNYSFDFISPKPNLNSISLRLKNTSLRNTQPVEFRLYQANKLVRQINLNRSNIGNGTWVRMSFNEISNSKSKSFKFELLSKSAEQDALAIHLNSRNEPAMITYHNISSRINLISEIYFGLFSKVFHLDWLLI